MSTVWHGIVLYSDAHNQQQVCGTLTFASVIQQVREFSQGTHHYLMKKYGNETLDLT